MAVVIRMRRLGRKHRAFWRICATDSRNPRDGRFIEELGTYDPSVHETDARVTFNNERLTYWLGVGALPSEKVAILIKKYGPTGTHLEQQKAALARIASPKVLPVIPKFVMKPKAEPVAAAAEAPAEGGGEAASSEG